jgi:hypothetical protein
VIAVGSVYRGPWSQRYWSSAGCLFHHAYPVGYRATKLQFGRTFEMHIEAGTHGPVFKATPSPLPRAGTCPRARHHAVGVHVGASVSCVREEELAHSADSDAIQHY